MADLPVGADAGPAAPAADRADPLQRRASGVSEAIAQLFTRNGDAMTHGGVAAQQTQTASSASASGATAAPLLITDSPTPATLAQCPSSSPAARRGSGASGSLAMGLGVFALNPAASTSTTRGLAVAGANNAAMVGARDVAAAAAASASAPDASDATLPATSASGVALSILSAVPGGQPVTRPLSLPLDARRPSSALAVAAGAAQPAPVPAPASTASSGAIWDPSATVTADSASHSTGSTARLVTHPHSHSHSHGHRHARHGSNHTRAFTAGSSAAAAAAAAAVAAGPMTLAPVPSPSVPFLHPSGSCDSSASLSIRQRIRKQISGIMQEKAARNKDDIAREWGAILARWNEFQPAVSSGGGGGGASGGVSAATLANNQRKLSALLMTTGIPSHLRASVWLLIIGNGLGLAPAAFEALRSSCAEKRAHYEKWRRRTNNNRYCSDSPLSDLGGSAPCGTEALRASAEPAVSDGSSFSPAASSSSPDVSLDPAYASFSLIDQDLPRTFPELQFFHNDGPYQQPLREVLECTAAFRAQRERERAEAAAAHQLSADGVHTRLPSPPALASSGYVQGMSHLGSILLLALGDDAFLAFVALSNLLENPAEPLSALLTMRADVGSLWMRRFDLQLQRSLPTLHAHFSSIGLQGEMWLYKMVLSIFAQSLHLDAVFRVWDCFLYESFKNRASNSHSPVTPRLVPPQGAPSPSSNSSGATGSSGGGGVGNSQCGSGFPFLFRVALGLLSMYADSLCQVGFEDALYFLHHLPGKQSLNAPPAAAPQTIDDELDVDLLFQHVAHIKMQPSVWENNAV